jgi:hypothetical protein
MASRNDLFSGVFDSFEKSKTEQEGKVDAPTTGGRSNMFANVFDTESTPAIDSTTVSSQAVDSAKLMQAIKQTESGGNFAAKGTSGETGAFQFMPATWKQYSSEYNQGRGSIEQTPESEEAVVEFKINQWIDEGLSPQEIAATWNSGSAKDWQNKRGTNKQGVQYDVPAYVDRVLSAYGGPVESEVPDNDRELEMQLGQAHRETTYAQRQWARDQSSSLWDTIFRSIGGGGQFRTETIDDFENMSPVVKNNLEAASISWEQGTMSIESGRLGWKDRMNTITSKELTRLKEIEKKQQGLTEELEGKPYVAKAVGQFAPFIANSIKQYGENAVIGGVATGALFAIAGNATPIGALIPGEEAITATLGFKLGAAIFGMFGSTSDIGEIEGGAVFREATALGMERDKAGKMADFVNTGSSSLEVFGMGPILRLIPGGKKLVSELLRKAITKEFAKSATKRAAGGYVKNIGQETAVETSQEIWANIAQTVAKEIRPELDKTDMSAASVEEVVSRIFENVSETALMTATAMTVMGMPGAAVNISTSAVASGAEHVQVHTDQSGVTVAVEDTASQVDVKQDAESVPSVETLLGVETDPSNITTPDGVSVSDDLTVTDKQRVNQHQGNDSLKQILGELAGEKAMDKQRLLIDTSLAKLDSFVGFYNDMVEAKDAPGGLQMAQMMEQETSNVIGSYQKLLEAADARAKNKKMLPNPDMIESVQNEVRRLKEQSDTRVQSQTKLVQAEQQVQRQQYIDSLDTVDGLQTELISATNRATRENQPKLAKLYNNVISEMRFRQASGHVDYFSKTPMKKLVNLDVQATLVAEENKTNPNVSADVIERDNAISRWIKQQQDDRLDYDQVQLLGERITFDAQVEQKQKAEAAAKTQKAEAKPAVKTIARRKKGEEAQKQRKERTRISKIAAERKKAQGVVVTQAKEIRKPIPGPTRTAELEEAKADKATRVAAIERQKKEVEAHEPKAVGPELKQDSVFKTLAAEVKETLRRPLKLKKSTGVQLKQDSFFRVLVSGIKETFRSKKDFGVVKGIKDSSSTWTILTSDNPGSKTATPAANVKARRKLKLRLDLLGIPYKIGKSKFGKDIEVPFIIPALSRKAAKKLSDELGQDSFIFAKGKQAHFIKGTTVTTVDKSTIKESTDPNEDYTELGGERFTIPFFPSEASILDTSEMQVPADVATDAKKLFRAAAFRLPNGKVIEGASHLKIMMQSDAVENYVNNATMAELTEFKADGFVTHTGQYVNRAEASKLVGTDILISEDFLGAALEQRLQDKNITAPNLNKMPREKKLGTLEVMDALEKEMKLGKYKFLFDTTKEYGVKTIFVTDKGQFGKLQEVIRRHGNAKAIDDAVKRFEGDMQINSVTGNMSRIGGTFGLYIQTQKAAIINLPLIDKFTNSIKKALETVTHEHIHALVHKAIEKMPQAQQREVVAELRTFWDGIGKDFLAEQMTNPDVHPRIKKGIDQSNKSVTEIVTYALAHPEFAAWLNKIPASPRFKAKKSYIKTMWDALTDLIVTKILRMPSKHDELIDILNTRIPLGEKIARFSKDDISFDFGENVDHFMATNWAEELDTLAVNALETKIAVNADSMAVMLGFAVPANTEAVWTGDGTLIINADNITSKERFVKVWMHEQVAHQGLRNIFGKNKALFNRFLDQSYTLFSVKEQEAVVAMAQLHDIFVGKDKKGKWVMKFTKAERRLLAEEMIARRAETLKPVTKRGLITRFKSFIKRWLPAKFTDVKADFILNDKDIMNMLEIARENVFTGSDKFGIMLDKAVAKRRPKHKSLAGKNAPTFMESDETYLEWAAETQKAAPHLKKWYSQHVETIRKHFGKDSQLFSVLLAITSPQADVEINVQYAINTYAYLMGVRDEPGARYPGKLQKRIDSKWTSPDAMLANLESGHFKVTEFARALLGDANATVGDLWMYRLFYGDPATTANKDDETYSIPQITSLREKLISLAAQMSAKTDEVWTPREMQAALWVNINSKQTGKNISEVASYQSGLNRPSAMYGGKTPLAWLQAAIPGLSEGKLSDLLGIENIPLAPISPLEKKLIAQKGKEVKGKYPVSKAGVIRVLSPGVDNNSTARMMNAIVNGGREVTASSEEMATWYQGTFGFEKMDDSLNMKLSDQAIQLYSDKNDKVKINLVRDNLTGFSGNYTRAIRFSKDAEASLNSMAALNSAEDDVQFLSTHRERESHVNKIHVWRDKAELNINRLFAQLEQEFLEMFGGRKSRIKVVGTGRFLHTSNSEITAKAMNLYIDSGAGENLAKVEQFHKKLMAKKSRTVAETEKLKIVDKMLNLSAAERAWADENVRVHYDQFFNFAQKHDILDTHIEDYVKRVWVMPEKYKDAGITWDGTGTTGFKLTPSSGKQRSLGSIIDGWELGLELKTEGVLSNLQAYASEIGYVYANRRFVDYMRSLIGPSGESSVLVVRDKAQNPPDGFVKLTTRGFAAPGKVVYARADMGKLLNKIGKRASDFWDVPALKATRRVNSMLKSTILSVTMFHHLAGLRSYVYGVRGTGLLRARPFKAYREGLKKIDKQTGFKNPNYNYLGPIVNLLVGQGLTLGKIQDWEEMGVMDSTISEYLHKQTIPGAHMALHGWEGARRWKRQWTNGLFGQLFAGLKAQSAAVELTREINKKEKDLKRGLTEEEVNHEALLVARLINADYGGLHLGRMGRNPDLQRMAQMLLLAPDWTESNWRTVTGMAPGNIVNKAIGKAIGDNPGPEGMQKVYRKFWWGIAWKGAISVLAAQFAVLALFGDEDDRKEYLKQIGEASTMEGFAKGRWASVDITPIIKTFGGTVPKGKRTDMNLLGHFKDILKVTDPVTLAKHKLSPITRLAESSLTRTDWKGDRFRTVAEMWQHGSWQLTAEDYNDPKYVEGWGAGASQLFAASLYNVRQSFPIPLSEVAQAMAGESSWLASIGRGLGVDVRDVRHTDPNEAFYWDKSQEIQQLERNLDEAKQVRDNRMITEARMDMRKYDNFNRTKSRLGFARSRLSPLNKKIRALEAKQDKFGLSKSEAKQLQDQKRKKADVYQKFADVVGR